MNGQLFFLFLQTDHDMFDMQFSLKKRPLKINMMRGVSVPFMLYDSFVLPIKL